MGAGTGNGAHPCGLGSVAKIADQFLHIGGKAVLGRHVAAQRAGRGHVAARRTAKAKVDAAGKQRGQRAEVLRHGERGVVGQHDPAGTHADRAGGRRDMADHHRRRGAGNAGHVVMFGQPKAMEAQPLGRARQIRAGGQRIGGGFALGDG